MSGQLGSLCRDCCVGTVRVAENGAELLLKDVGEFFPFSDYFLIVVQESRDFVFHFGERFGIGEEIFGVTFDPLHCSPFTLFEMVDYGLLYLIAHQPDLVFKFLN